MEQPTWVPQPPRILGSCGQKAEAAGEMPPDPVQEPGDPEELHIALPLGEDGQLLECPLCLLPQPPEAFPSLVSCSHRSCRACLQQYLRIAVSESRVRVACPHCPTVLQPADVHSLLPEPALRDKYEEFLLRRLLAADPGTRWCPAPDCSYAVIAYGFAECPRLTCGREGCGTEFCYHCRQLWHPDGPCAAAPLASSLASPSAQLVYAEESANAEAEDIKVCPRCSAFIMKINDGSCNRMNCTVCGCLFCWLCLQEISDVHFLSPSGCTFWGKRPWSRTRKILWQLGMVLGAPMVISLVAGIAVPVIIIGLPIYTGRKVLGQSRRSSLSPCQQCFSVTSGVLLSLFVSPIITAVTVVNELWSVLPSPKGVEDGVADPATSFPSSSHSPRPRVMWKEQDSHSASTVALAGSTLSDTSYREGINIEVEVAIESVPHPSREQSLCSPQSGQSLSGDSLGGTSDKCSVTGVPVE
ncbi:E3 ubiquitin-protein ligase RNF19B-like isoform X2 [Lagopus leucura]|uniref:E3 ubiquitin-protein ligase RNF19B-like isoform X2 n=1 Tax=Lagopus leucura TaxID=30410 RepID=UPI001C676875|nr:E3 ubiquitin-protein ligase RNF19B-like isoform X2 [Lagopus leucura]